MKIICDHISINIEKKSLLKNDGYNFSVQTLDDTLRVEGV